jgi:predicted nucleic acid-binding protein
MWTASSITWAIYLDTCCLNRPFDDQTQERIRLEAEATLLILTRIETGSWKWIGSEVLDFEIEQIPDQERKERVRLMTPYISRSILVELAERERAQQLETLGFSAFDALHLACAESGDADVFLTTDDRLLLMATRLSKQLRVQVENPLVWLNEVTKR